MVATKSTPQTKMEMILLVHVSTITLPSSANILLSTINLTETIKAVFILFIVYNFVYRKFVVPRIMFDGLALAECSVKNSGAFCHTKIKKKKKKLGKNVEDMVLIAKPAVFYLTNIWLCLKNIYRWNQKFFTEIELETGLESHWM